MRFRLLVFAALIAVVATVTAFTLEGSPSTATPSNEPCSIGNSAFQGGEELTYVVYYYLNSVWVAAGEVNFKVKDAGTQWSYSAVGKTYPSYEWFFKVRDEFSAYADKKTLLPYLSTRNISEGDYRLYDRVSFDQVNHKAVNKRGRTSAKLDTYKFDLKECMHDVVSILYYMRNIDFNTMKQGSKVPVKIFLDTEIYPLNVKYIGKETKDIKDNGKHKTVHISPEVVAGQVFKEGTQVHVWATDDANKVPLLIESPIAVGSVKCVLKSTKGLRNPSTSKVK
jgi:hypothetical protein